MEAERQIRAAAPFDSAFFLFDTGTRIGEVLKLRVSDINLDDLLATLDGAMLGEHSRARDDHAG